MHLICLICIAHEPPQATAVSAPCKMSTSKWSPGQALTAPEPKEGRKKWGMPWPGIPFHGDCREVLHSVTGWGLFLSSYLLICIFIIIIPSCTLFATYNFLLHNNYATSHPPLNRVTSCTLDHYTLIDTSWSYTLFIVHKYVNFLHINPPQILILYLKGSFNIKEKGEKDLPTCILYTQIHTDAYIPTYVLHIRIN